MSALAFKVVIPARYALTRLPAKPLLDLGGKPMVVRVAERARRSGAEEVWVATDHLEVRDAAEANEIAALMTRSDHATGTDRLAEVVERLGWHGETIVVNVQGDEPLIEPEVILQTARQLAASGADIATVAHPIVDAADFFNPNVVKVVCRADGDAAYFSRAPIPYARDHFAQELGGETLPARLPGLSPCRPLCLPGELFEGLCRVDRGTYRTIRGARAVARAVAWLPDQRDADRCGAGAGGRYAGGCGADAQTV